MRKTKNVFDKNLLIYAAVIACLLWCILEIKTQQELLENQAKLISSHSKIQVEFEREIYLVEMKLNNIETNLQQWNMELSQKNEEFSNIIKEQSNTIEQQQKTIEQLQAAKEKTSWKTFHATAYTPYCAGCTGITRTGINVRNTDLTQKIIAVDPKVIPLGSIVEIEGLGKFVAEDTGGAIKGFKIDILHPTKAEMRKFGRRDVKLRIIRYGRA